MRKASINEDFLKEFTSIEWFSNCGSMNNIKLDCSIEYVSNWSQAEQVDEEEEWDKLVSNSREKLFEFITKKLLYSTRDFNALIASARESSYYKDAVEKINIYIEKERIDFKFSNLLAWMILNAAVEYVFKEQKGCPNFFINMYKVIKEGHCPCGWNGNWPKGTLYVY